MRVIGVDPGLTRCGVGVIDGAPGQRCSLVHVTVIRTSPDIPLAQRLLSVADGIRAAIDAYSPEALAVEQVFSQQNRHSVIGTAQASAVALLEGARADINTSTHTPTEVKAAVTGSGRADKTQVTAMVMRILNLATPPKPADAADALALGICHAWKSTVLSHSRERLHT